MKTFGAKSYRAKSQVSRVGYLRFFSVGIIILILFISGCSSTDEKLQLSTLSKEANTFFNQGDYQSTLSKCQQIIANHPETTDRILFEMGIIYAHPGNYQKNYQKALESFQQIIKDYPDSAYRYDSQMMMFQIRNVITKDKMIAAQQLQIETSRQEIKAKENKVVALQDRIDSLEKEIVALRKEPADKVLIEKKARRMRLLLNGEVIKTYRIALGGDPVGPKERAGDNKTPEGFYIIDARNMNSQYHLSLRISYPNENDLQRAQELGVSPGGDIMIHGIKNGLAWVGVLHSVIDWTKGCIAVTDSEIREINRLVPDGTIVEIRP